VIGNLRIVLLKDRDINKVIGLVVVCHTRTLSASSIELYLGAYFL
jgi:hypothetical protein